MKLSHKSKNGKCFIIGGLLLLISMASVGSVPAADLTEAEKIWLTYMREEEKVARDVYLFMGEIWGSQIFKNISASEQTHMDAIKTLLDRYGLADPALDNGIGKFTNSELQALYTELIYQGNESLTAALQVGVIIEETDIDDLNQGIDSTQRKDIKKVYGNLLQGSLNHHKAFVSNLALLGVVYE